MKKKLFLFILFFYSITKIFAMNEVTIVVEMDNEEVKEIIVNENVGSLTFSAPEFRTISNIIGLDKVKNLENLEFYNLTFTNMGFISKCKNLKTLWISGCTIIDFSFIENMEELEDLYLDFYIDFANNEIIKKSQIDIKKLKKLKKIYFTGIIKQMNHYSKYGSIPLFQNASPECTLILVDQGIEHLSDEDIYILNNFKSVDLSFNPICSTDEITKLKKVIYEK